MPRLRVRNEDDNTWFDACDKPMYVRNEDNTDWVRLYPRRFAVRDGANSNWLDIDCSFDGDFDSSCDVESLGLSCPGNIDDALAGSGDGKGSGGQEFALDTGYPAGYDMPDAGKSGFGVATARRLSYEEQISSDTAINHSGPEGLLIERPGLSTFESYDSHSGSPSDISVGSYSTPNKIGASSFSRGAAVSETIYRLGPAKGYIGIAYAAYCPISIDVYYMGKRVASTCGQVPEKTRGLLSFHYDAGLHGGEERIMIRVRGDEGVNWAYQVLDATSTPLLLNEFDPYDSDMYGDLDELHEEDDLLMEELLGTPAFPAPCHARVEPIPNRIIDKDFYEYYHYVGTFPGIMYLDYTVFDTADFIEVYYGNTRIASTKHNETGLGYLRFEYGAPEGCQIQDLVVRVYTENFGIGETLSSWYYTLFCIGAKGHRQEPFPCENNQVLSMGHVSTEDNFDLENGVSRGAVSIEFNSFDTTNIVSVFDRTGALIKEKVINGGTGEITFFKLAEHATTRDQIFVRVDGPMGTYWEYTVGCPVPLLDVDLTDVIVPCVCDEDIEPPEPTAELCNVDWEIEVNLKGINAEKLYNYEPDDLHEYMFWMSDLKGSNEITLGRLAIDKTTLNAYNVVGKVANRGGPNSVVVWNSDQNSLEFHGEGGKFLQVVKRPLNIIDTTPDPLSCDWERVYSNLSSPANSVNYEWKDGYEYFVWIADDHKVNEIAICHVLPNTTVIPPSSNDGYCAIGWTNWVEFDFDKANPTQGRKVEAHEGRVIQIIERRITLKESKVRENIDEFVLVKEFSGDGDNREFLFSWKDNYEYLVYMLDTKGTNEISMTTLVTRADLWNESSIEPSAGLAARAGPNTWVRFIPNTSDLTDPIGRKVDAGEGRILKIYERPMSMVDTSNELLGWIFISSNSNVLDYPLVANDKIKIKWADTSDASTGVDEYTYLGGAEEFFLKDGTSVAEVAAQIKLTPTGIYKIPGSTVQLTEIFFWAG